MNKTEMLQFHALFTELAGHLDAETPTYDSIGFTPIVSDRFTHADATLALATDVREHISVDGEAESTQFALAD